MSSDRRPMAVLLVSCLYMAVGSIGLLVNLSKLIAMQHDWLWIELTELLALFAGVFMFRGRNWARWLALVWMAFHVAISFPVIREIVNHSIILVLITWVLFLPDTRRFFKPLKVHG